MIAEGVFLQAITVHDPIMGQWDPMGFRSVPELSQGLWLPIWSNVLASTLWGHDYHVE